MFNIVTNPPYPQYTVIYLDSFQIRALELLDERYKSDKTRIVNNCKTYYRNSAKFEDRKDNEDWSLILNAAKTQTNFFGSAEAENAEKQFKDKSYIFPRINLPWIPPSQEEIKKLMDMVAEFEWFEPLQAYVEELELPNRIVDPEFENITQMILNYELSSYKSHLLWSFIGMTAIDLEWFNSRNGLNPIFKDPKSIPEVLYKLRKNGNIDENNNWLGIRHNYKVEKSGPTIYALISVLYEAGYLNEPDNKSNRRAFINFFGLNIKETTYSHIGETSKFDSCYQEKLRKAFL